MAGLGFFNAETVQSTADLDLGPVAPRSSEDSGLWLTNSSDYRAENVTVTIEGADASQMWLSFDGENFSSSLSVGDISPGGSSIPFWLRRVTPGTSPMGSRTATVVATPQAWVIPVDTSTSDNIPLD